MDFYTMVHSTVSSPFIKSRNTSTYFSNYVDFTTEIDVEKTVNSSQSWEVAVANIVSTADFLTIPIEQRRVTVRKSDQTSNFHLTMEDISGGPAYCVMQLAKQVSQITGKDGTEVSFQDGKLLWKSSTTELINRGNLLSLILGFPAFCSNGTNFGVLNYWDNAKEFSGIFDSRNHKELRPMSMDRGRKSVLFTMHGVRECVVGTGHLPLLASATYQQLWNGYEPQIRMYRPIKNTVFNEALSFTLQSDLRMMWTHAVGDTCATLHFRIKN